MTGTYDLFYVVLSFAISVFGSYTGLVLAGQITNQHNSFNRLWLGGAAVSIGGGAIWAMHFIGMIAYKMPIFVSYDALLTVVSLLVAIVFTGIGVLLVIRQPKMHFGRLASAGVIMGLGVAAMHYTGMAAMRVGAIAHHDPKIVAVSLVIAIVASSAALWIAFTLRKTWQKIISAFVMGVAVCGMHYTAMTGLYFEVVAGMADPISNAIPANELAGHVSVATVAVLIISLVAVFAKQLRELDHAH